MKNLIFIFSLFSTTFIFGQFTITGNPSSYKTGMPATISVTYTITGETGNWDITATCPTCAAPTSQTFNNVSGGGGSHVFIFNTPPPAVDLTFGGTAKKGSDTQPFTNATTLDIKLISFEAKQEDSGVILIWKVASETDNDFMAVERSFDGELFSEIGQVKGRGTTLIPFTYNFVDYSASEGVNYYRLRQVDFDKSIQYSKVIAINAPGSVDILSFPNPAKDKITVQYDYSKGAGNIQMFDALGRRVNASIAGYAGNYEVKLPDGLAKGTYWLKVERGGQVQTLPVVKE